MDPEREVGSFDFNSWLGGFIDGDGTFGLNQGKYPFCEITVHSTEVQVLAKIKAKFGGSVSKRTSSSREVNAYRWRLHNAVGMRRLVAAVNGNLHLPVRISQFEQVCAVLDVSVLRKPLTKSSS